MRIKYLGHSALLIEDGDFKALIDPYLSDNPSYIDDSEDTEGITHIFITHAHQDHIGDSVDIARDNNSVIICNAEISKILYTSNRDLRFHPMHVGGSHHFPFGKVKMVPAVHGSGYTDSDGKIYDGGNPSGFVITVNGKTLYHAGDTGLTYDMKLLAHDKIDVAFLPIGGNYTMDIDDAVRAVSFIDPKFTVPMHYNTFGLINADPNEFVRKLPYSQVVILESTEEIEI